MEKLTLFLGAFYRNPPGMRFLFIFHFIIFPTFLAPHMALASTEECNGGTTLNSGELFVDTNAAGFETCDPEKGASDCDYNFECLEEITDPTVVRVPRYTYNFCMPYATCILYQNGSLPPNYLNTQEAETCLDGTVDNGKMCKDFTSTTKYVGGQSPDPATIAETCLSGVIDGGKCTPVALCGSCVPTGFTTADPNLCCEGSTYNRRTRKCELATPVDNPVLSLSQIGSANSATCTFEYTADLQFYIDNYLELHTLEMLAFVWLFGGEVSSESDTGTTALDGSELFELPKATDEGQALSSYLGSFDPNQIIRNPSDFYPFYDMTAYRNKVNEDGPTKLSDYATYSQNGTGGNIALHEAAKSLRRTYAAGIKVFQEKQQELLAELETLSEGFSLNQYTQNSNSVYAGGEGGADYYKALLEYYTAINEREYTLNQTISTVKTGLNNWYRDVYSPIYQFQWKNADGWRPKACDNDYNSSSDFINNTNDSQECLRLIWEFEYKNENDSGLNQMDTLAMVDPVFRLRAKTLKNMFDKVKRREGKLSLRFTKINDRNKEDLFRKAILDDIKWQMNQEWNVRETKTYTDTSAGTSYDSIFRELTEEQKDRLAEIAYFYMLTWNGYINAEEDQSIFRGTKTLTGIMGGSPTYATQISKSDRRNSCSRGSAQNIFDWTSRNEYPIPFRESALYYINSQGAGGILYVLEQLENFYANSKIARDEMINCLSNQIAGFAANGGVDARGATGATDYTNQDTQTVKSSADMAEDCPPSTPGCGESNVGVNQLNLALGSSSASDLGDKNKDSKDSKGTSTASANLSGSKQGAVRDAKASIEEMTKNYGEEYAQKASQVKPATQVAKILSGSGLSSSSPIMSVNTQSEKTNASGTPGPDGNSGIVGEVKLDSGKASKEGKSGWRNQGYGGKYGAGNSSENLPNQDTNYSGLSSSEVDNMLNASKDSRYNSNPDDELFEIISKRYVKSAYPSLLERRSKVESIKRSVSGSEKESSSMDGPELYQPWKKFKTKDSSSP